MLIFIHKFPLPMHASRLWTYGLFWLLKVFLEILPRFLYGAFVQIDGTGTEDEIFERVRAVFDAWKYVHFYIQRSK